MTTKEQITICVNETENSIIRKMKTTALRNWRGCPLPTTRMTDCSTIVPDGMPLAMVCRLRKVTELDTGACIIETPCRRIQEYFKPREAVK